LDGHADVLESLLLWSFFDKRSIRFGEYETRAANCSSPNSFITLDSQSLRQRLQSHENHRQAAGT